MIRRIYGGVSPQDSSTDASAPEEENLFVWTTFGGCELCRANEAVGPVPQGYVFPSGDTEPPAHRNCQCELKSLSSGRVLKAPPGTLRLPSTYDP